jgi:lipoprotein-anchoring transpeptidase ErfK/SrfK
MAGSLTTDNTNCLPPPGERIAQRQFRKQAACLITALTLLANLTLAATVGAEPLSSPAKPASKGQAAVRSQAPEPFMNRKIVINIPSRILWVYEGSAIIRYFPVGVGRPGFMTPVGKYSIISKVVDPGWENPYLPNGRVRLAPGENNPLGTRWMGFYQKAGGEYGMHGTDNPASVGKFSSHGCVRMKVKDAEALFELVDLGTPVEVVYEPVLVRKHDNEIRVTVYADRFKRGMPTVEQIKGKILKQYPEAQVDLSRLQAALAQPNERPVSVGSLPEEDILMAAPADDTQTTPSMHTQPDARIPTILSQQPVLNATPATSSPALLNP